MALRGSDQKILNKLLDWIGLDRPPRERPKPEDDLHDIKDLTIDYFWRRCEEFLPDDWGLALLCRPRDDGGLLYWAEADLLEGDIAMGPGRKTQFRDTPERALEELFYMLRDML